MQFTQIYVMTHLFKGFGKSFNFFSHILETLLFSGSLTNGLAMVWSSLLSKHLIIYCHRLVLVLHLEVLFLPYHLKSSMLDDCHFKTGLRFELCMITHTNNIWINRNIRRSSHSQVTLEWNHINTSAVIHAICLLVRHNKQQPHNGFSSDHKP